jgi:hypothetical protein
MTKRHVLTLLKDTCLNHGRRVVVIPAEWLPAAAAAAAAAAAGMLFYELLYI